MLSRLDTGEASTLHDRIYQQLSLAIVDGQFEAGQLLTLQGAATVLGTSIMPVRDAIRRLVSEQALEMSSPRRIRVPLASPEKLVAQFTARRLVEGEAAAMVARSASHAELEGLMELETGDSAPDHDVASSVVLARQFWSKFFAASGSDLFVHLSRILALQFGPYLGSVLRTGSSEHVEAVLGLTSRKPLLRCVAAGDAEGARAVVSLRLSTAAGVFRTLF